MDFQWINREAYPFQSNFLDLSMGKMHYVDEGQGEPIVMLHGNPTWSFLYRHLIKGLSQNYRCVAPDYIGFGLSDKPETWSYLPEDHAENFKALIEELDLKEITLVVQDWGGPIGLSYAVGKPKNVKRLIIMNTWMWSVKGDPHFARFSGLIGGSVGHFLIRRFNFFARVVMKQAFADKSRLPKSAHEHYLRPLKHPNDRKGCAVFPRQIIGSSDWLDSLWSQRDKLKNKPTQILWGMKDIAFRAKELQTWRGLFENCKVIELAHVGHYVQEEMGSALSPLIADFLKRKPGKNN
ncbi:MAG: alpha/beta fold hydrolase [bacterium]